MGIYIYKFTYMFFHEYLFADIERYTKCHRDVLLISWLCEISEICVWKNSQLTAEVWLRPLDYNDRCLLTKKITHRRWNIHFGTVHLSGRYWNFYLCTLQRGVANKYLKTCESLMERKSEIGHHWPLVRILIAETDQCIPWWQSDTSYQ